MATRKQIINDWQQLFPELKKTGLLSLDNRLGPLITGIYIKVVRNTYYTPVAYVHNLCSEESGIITSLECTSETIALEKHEERYIFSAERLKNKLLIPLEGDVPIDKIIEGDKLFLSNPKRKSFEEYKDIALVCGWYGEKKKLDDILKYIWENVQKDKEHPFSVDVNGSVVKVLGTSFNVRAYADENEILTTLVQGSVRFSAGKESVVLKPGEQAVLNKSGRVVIKEVDTYLYTAWKNGVFAFEKQRLEEIMNVVARWYDVNIFWENASQKEVTFTGKMKRYDDFSKVVEMLEMTGNTEFVVKENNIFIREK